MDIPTATVIPPALPGLPQAETQAPPKEGAKPAPSPFGGGFLVPMLLIVGIFYFVLIRPEKRKQKDREALLQSIKKGDRVMTSSGMFGSVAQVQEDVITLQVADGVRIRFSRAAIQNVIDKDEKD